jgi:membrane protease YdiL (CAAX protease family)
VADWRELWNLLLAWLIVALAGGLVALVIWKRTPAPLGLLLGPKRSPAVPWLGIDVCLVFFILLAAPILIGSVPVNFGWVNLDSEADKGRAALWIQALAMPIQVAAILFSLSALHNAQPYQLGLAPRRLPQSYLAGYFTWLVLAPATLLIYFGTTILFEPEPHALTRISQQGLTPIEWGLLVFGAVVVAPAVEELVFRGVLFPWLTRAPWNAHAMVALCAVAASILFTLDKHANINNWAPAVFVLAMFPGYGLCALLDRRRPRQVNGAIYGSALLFTAFHANAWPSPIPLFVLGVGLAWLRYRTQSLVAPVVLHLLFNAIACLVMVLTPD